MRKKSQLLVFIKAQASAFIGGLVDYLVMVLCTELLGIHYTISIGIGGIVGAGVNFSINRQWTYRAGEGRLPMQMVKFVTVVLGSIFLKSTGTYLLTSWLGIDYKLTRIVVDLIVSLGFNYTLQTYWVFFKKSKMTE